ncbi:MAG: NIPSNAP family protein [Pseudomonadota bacterium]
MSRPITCVIEYEIDPWAQDSFAHYAELWGQAIPACGADLIGYFAPHEGSVTKGYGIYTLPSLASYEAYKERLRAHPIGQEAYQFAMKERFIRREDRTFLTLASAPHAPLVTP